VATGLEEGMNLPAPPRSFITRQSFLSIRARFDKKRASFGGQRTDGARVQIENTHFLSRAFRVYAELT
jgi:hypothetical protein